MERDAAVATLQQIIDDLLFYSDEIEFYRLPWRYDGAAAVRMAAAFIAIQRDLVLGERVS